MDLDNVLDLARTTLWTAIILVAPPLLAGLLVGLLVSLFQTVVAIQEQTLALVPKMLAVALTILLLLPWTLNRLVEFAESLFLNLDSWGPGA
ncbi:MAG: flagellar biosynthetic protein FliQ [Planctomycetota bacterium]